MADAKTDREVEAASILKQWDALPEKERAPTAMRDLLARTQADFISAATELERLQALHPDD